MQKKKIDWLKANGFVECGVILKSDAPGDNTIVTVDEHGRVQWWELGVNGEIQLPRDSEKTYTAAEILKMIGLGNSTACSIEEVLASAMQDVATLSSMRHAMDKWASDQVSANRLVADAEKWRALRSGILAAQLSKEDEFLP